MIHLRTPEVFFFIKVISHLLREPINTLLSSGGHCPITTKTFKFFLWAQTSGFIMFYYALGTYNLIVPSSFVLLHY